jgi:hypothetical protein
MSMSCCYAGCMSETPSAPRARRLRWVKRISLLILVLGLLVYLAGAAIVAMVDPLTGAVTGDPEFERVLSRALGDDARPVLFFQPGYTDSYTVKVGDSIERIRVTRGPLDRKAGAFPLTYIYAYQGPGTVDTVRLEVTSDPDWHEDGNWQSTTWTRIGEAEITPGSPFVVVSIVGNAPASTTAYQVAGACEDGSCYIRSGDIPTSPTTLGRIHDTIGHWPLFSWVPKLR